MKKRNKKHKPFHASIPMLVNRKLNENIEGKEEISMVNSFQFGTATKAEYDYLVRMANMLNIAGQTKGVQSVVEAVNSINFLARLILERYQRTGKFGVDGEELGALRDVVVFFDSFWKRQTTDLYNECVFQLNHFYKEINDKREVA